MLDALPGTLLMQWLGVPVLEALSSLAPDGRRRHDERVEPEVEASRQPVQLSP